ncbi:FecR family protein [Pseudogemmobacter bohemicus]|uniref:FecR family protein n=1 Tax=Pseudogemmobacter bohemicus TaxID=2250708 RepID=UPI000DD2EE90|nr:FecR domain-containing protein [Pseudogemmobacter bohemicus]
MRFQDLTQDQRQDQRQVASRAPGEAEAAKREAEAARWLVDLIADPAARQDAGFQAWAGDPANARAFATAEKAWDMAADLAPDLAREFPRQERPVGRSWRWPRLLPAGLAMAALALAGIWLDQVRPDLRLALLADHASRAGAAQALALSDGSRLVLDGGSALDFADLADGRQVTLLGGAAFFDVAKDGRPFTVRLGRTTVRALGTRFAVRDCGGCIEVTLEEGRVEVATDGGVALALEPGQQLRQVADGPERIRAVDLPAALAWREGRYTFYDAPLRDVAGVLERHGAGAIFIRNPALAGRTISGSIDLGDAPAELEALAEAMGFRIIPLPGGQLLI